MIYRVLLLILLLTTSRYVSADIALTGYYGQTASQKASTELGTAIDINDDNNYALSIEKHLDSAKFGLFYSNLTSDQRGAAQYQFDMDYYMFQSAVVLPATEKLSSYLGAQLGVNRTETNFTDSDSFFAMGLYGGLEYAITQQFLILGEIRWLGTILNNSSSTSCEAESEGNQCDFYFDGELLNQYQFNIGLMYRF